MNAGFGPGRMTPETWARVERILDEALDLPEDERPAFLERVCANDAALHAHLERVLDADRDSGAFLERPAFEGLTGLLADDARDAAAPVHGRQVGPYRLEREIGRGGMGVVYLGKRADGLFDQTVAIKLVRSGVDAAEVRARFERERQILARLEHPNIARLLDGGITEDGVPYFAMELVEGVPLTRHCHVHALSLKEVVRLFAQVCRAVQYAHRSLVVHRDLKPGNILVSAAGEVKLLDFGIARLLDPEMDGDLTAATAPLLTPYYAAPEQVRGEPPTTATDVYALGVVLYELLAGVRPYRSKLASLEDAHRAILHEAPRTPSTATRGTAAPPRNAPGASAAPPGRVPAGPVPDTRQLAWRDRLKGDLDNIVLVALRKEPERRYASAQALLDDLERYLAGQPVRATPATLRYRARKYVQRHRAGVVMGSVLGVALLGGFASTAWQARVAADERDRARAEATKSEEIKNFVLGLFQAADPEKGRADKTTVRELLDQGTARVESELAGQPAVQADLYDLLGNVYANLSVEDRAETLLTRAIDLRRAMFGVHDTSYATSLMNLANHLSFVAEFERALALGRESIEIRRRVSPETAGRALNDFAITLNRVGQRAPAESLYRESLALDLARYGPEHVEVATTLMNYGLMLNMDDREREGEPMLRRAVEIRERLLGPEHLLTADAREALAAVLGDMGHFAGADSFMARVLPARERHLRPDHPDIGRFFANYATLRQKMGDYTAAESLFLKGLAIRRKAHGDDHFDVVSNMNNLAIVYYWTGDFENAARWFGLAHAGMVRTLGATHPGTLTCETNVGVVLRETGRLDEADRALAQAYAARRASLAADHPTIAHSLFHLGILRHRQGRLVEAERLLRRSLAIRRASYIADHPRIGETEGALADVLRDLRRYGEAAALYDDAIRIARNHYGEPHPVTADALEGKGRLLAANGRVEEALPLITESLRIRREKQPAFRSRIAELGDLAARLRQDP